VLCSEKSLGEKKDSSLKVRRNSTKNFSTSVQNEAVKGKSEKNLREKEVQIKIPRGSASLFKKVRVREDKLGRGLSKKVRIFG